MEKFQPVRVNELVRSPYRTYLELNGTWNFELDPQRAGEKENWQAGNKAFSDNISVPGSLEAQGKGLEYAL